MAVIPTITSWILSAIINYSSLTIPTTYNTASDIPPTLFQEHEKLYGRVVKVIDGDTIRVRHTPIPSMNNNFDGKLSDNTIIVRLYGIDAPETAKQGKPGMAYSIEATEFTKQLINNKQVTIKLLKKDQYNRVIGVVTVHPSSCMTCPDEDVSLELIKNGYAFLYRGSGSEYDGNKMLFEDGLMHARIDHKGLWRNGDDVLTPAEYKRLYSK